MADFKRVKDDVQVAMATDSPNKGLHDSSRVHVSPLERTALMQRRRTRRNRSWRNKYSIQTNSMVRVVPATAICCEEREGSENVRSKYGIDATDIDLDDASTQAVNTRDRKQPSTEGETTTPIWKTKQTPTFHTSLEQSSPSLQKLRDMNN